jgi:hypothetical protein
MIATEARRSTKDVEKPHCAQCGRLKPPRGHHAERCPVQGALWCRFCGEYYTRPHQLRCPRAERRVIRRDGSMVDGPRRT